MSDKTIARRTELILKLNNTDISTDINKYIISAVYTDNEEDKADDIRIELDDREGTWLEWIGKNIESSPTAESVKSAELKIGDIVYFKGGSHFHTSMDTIPVGGSRTAGMARITNTAPGARHPIHVIGLEGGSNVYGWVDNEQLTMNNEQLTINDNALGSSYVKKDIKGFKLSVVIIQKNPESDGNDRVLDCGEFEIDSINSNGDTGSGSRVSIKGTSLPHFSTVRIEKKSKAWENIKLSGVAAEIAQVNDMLIMYESSIDPLYSRVEQVQVSDIAFIQELCRRAGISIKTTNNMLVLFDRLAYEQKEAVLIIKKGESDIRSWRFGTSLCDTNYSRCRVSYTNPLTGITIEYTYTPKNTDPNGLTLEINEKVNTREEARNLAMKRLREKNKDEYQAEFTLALDVRFTAGVTVEVSGWGFFDGKYIIEQTICNISGSGGTLQVKLRRVLEDY